MNSLQLQSTIYVIKQQSIFNTFSQGFRYYRKK